MIDKHVLLSSYPFCPIGEYKEGDNVQELYEKANAINGDNQSTIRMNKRKTIYHPQGATQDCCNVGIWFERSHCSVHDYLLKCWATKKQIRKKSRQ